MDSLETLLRDTLTDAGRSAPTSVAEPPAEEHRSRRRSVVAIAAVAASVAVVAIAVPVALTQGGAPGRPASDVAHSTTPTPTHSSASPMPIHLGVYLSPDRRTLYVEVTERVAKRGA